MERIHAVTFAPFCARGTFEEETRQSLKLMKRKDGSKLCDFCTERCAEDSIFREH